MSQASNVFGPWLLDTRPSFGTTCEQDDLNGGMRAFREDSAAIEHRRNSMRSGECLDGERCACVTSCPQNAHGH